MMLNAERRGKSSRRVVFTFTKKLYLLKLTFILTDIDIDMNGC